MSGLPETGEHARRMHEAPLKVIIAEAGLPPWRH